MKDLLKWGLIGLVGYWVYENLFVTPATATSTTTPAATTTAATAAPGFNSLASIYSRIVGSVPANSLFTADQWNVALAAQSNVTPPDPAAVFTFTDASPRTATMTVAHYWSVMEPYLVAQGLSGFGLYRGMGSFYQRRRMA
jgi:hypothetical protein